MGDQEKGSPPHERRKGPRLTVRTPFIEKALAGLQFDGFDIDETRRFGNKIAAEAARFQVARITSDRGRISKRDAGRMLGLALARLSEGGEP